MKLSYIFPAVQYRARGRGALKFFGGYVPRGFPKVGSRERIFLEKKRGLGNENLENLRLESWRAGTVPLKQFSNVQNIYLYITLMQLNVSSSKLITMIGCPSRIRTVSNRHGRSPVFTSTFNLDSSVRLP